MKQNRICELLKIILIIMILLNIMGCQKKDENSDSIDGSIEEITTEEKEETELIDFWNIKPNLYYDNVIIDFKHAPAATIFTDDSDLYKDFQGDILVEKYGKYGLLDKEGNIVIKAIYADAVYRFHDIWFTSGGGQGPCAILKSDETITNYDDGCGIGSDGYYLAFKYTENGYKLIAYDSFDETNNIKKEHGNSFLLASFDEEDIYDYVLIDNDDVTLLGLNPKENHCFDYSSGIILFSSSKSYYDNYYATNAKYYDSKGKLLFDGFDGGLGFYEGYAPVKKGNKWGYIDINGNLVIDYIFDAATQIYEGKSWVIINGKLGKLNTIDVIESQERTDIIKRIKESQSENTLYFTGKTSDNLDNQSGIRIYAKNGITYQDGMKVVDENDYIGHLQLNKQIIIRIRDAARTYGKIVGHIYEYAIMPYYDRKTSDGYRWYKISKDHDYWIADDGTWLILGN